MRIAAAVLLFAAASAPPPSGAGAGAIFSGASQSADSLVYSHDMRRFRRGELVHVFDVKRKLWLLAAVYIDWRTVDGFDYDVDGVDELGPFFGRWNGRFVCSAVFAPEAELSGAIGAENLAGVAEPQAPGTTVTRSTSQDCSNGKEETV